MSRLSDSLDMPSFILGATIMGLAGLFTVRAFRVDDMRTVEDNCQGVIIRDSIKDNINRSDTFVLMPINKMDEISPGIQEIIRKREIKMLFNRP